LSAATCIGRDGTFGSAATGGVREGRGCKTDFFVGTIEVCAIVIFCGRDRGCSVTAGASSDISGTSVSLCFITDAVRLAASGEM
jgi:hypothetical protein